MKVKILTADRKLTIGILKQLPTAELADLQYCLANEFKIYKVTMQVAKHRRIFAYLIQYSEDPQLFKTFFDWGWGNPDTVNYTLQSMQGIQQFENAEQMDFFITIVNALRAASKDNLLIL